MMQHLLRRLVFDIPLLNEHTKMPLKVRIYLEFTASSFHFTAWNKHSGSMTDTMCSHLLNEEVLYDSCNVPFFQLLTNHFERCWKYYCLAGGWGTFGAASDEELHLSRKLFWGIFDALSRKVALHCASHKAVPLDDHQVGISTIMFLTCASSRNAEVRPRAF